MGVLEIQPKEGQGHFMTTEDQVRPIWNFLEIEA